MRPITYEIKRTLTSKFVIIMIVAIVGLASLLAYENGSTFSTVNVPTTPELTTGYYINGQNLTMVGYFHDAYGHPIDHITAYYEYNNTFYSSAANKYGFANATIPAIPTGKPVTVLVNFTYERFRQPVSSPQTAFQINALNLFSGLTVVNGIFNPANKSNLGLLALYVGSGGSTAPPITFYISQINLSRVSSVNPASLEANSTFSVTQSGFVETTIFPQVTAADRGMNYSVVATNTTGAFIAFTTSSDTSPVGILGPLSLYTKLSQSDLQGLVFSGTSQILGFLIPILAIFAAYLTYGKDRTTGVLESVLKRPITRGEIIFSRFISNSVAIIGAVALSMLFSDLIINHYLGSYLSAYFDAYFIWTYVVEGLSFLALVYLFSHLVKSQGALLGAAIAIFVVWDLFWTIIPIAILSALGIGSSTNTYLSAEVLFNYISPAGYGSLVQTFFTGKIGLISSTSINPALFGINVPLLITAGILWMVVPFAIAFSLAVKRD
jgi:ABC-2 type transport system permease protein